MSSVLKPIFDLVDNSQSYNEVLSVLDSLKPTMNSAEIELKLTKLIWIAQILGSKDVRDGV
jgi:phage gp29-like protein